MRHNYSKIEMFYDGKEGREGRIGRRGPHVDAILNDGDGANNVAMIQIAHHLGFTFQRFPSTNK